MRSELDEIERAEWNDQVPHAVFVQPIFHL
jgi:hypothetical protein